MNKLFSTLFSSLRAKFTSLWTRLRLWVSPTFWRTRVFTWLRRAFSTLFDVRPKHKKDYYVLLNWMVSKRLAFAIVVVLGVLCVWFILSMLPTPASAGNTGVTINTYRYNSIPLKFQNGTVRILAADGHLAYVGQVQDAKCEGAGTLYDKDGNTVYEGAFSDNMYNGTGTTYYADGTVQYTGNFTDNLYNGVGKYFRPTGVLEYEGDYVTGVRSGKGTLYNSTGSSIFTGSFQKDQIVFGELVDKATTDVAQMYTGVSQVYSSSSEYCVYMEEIGAVYAVADGTAALDDSWNVTGVYVLGSSALIEGEIYSSINRITQVLGDPDYSGTAWVDLAEAVCVNQLVQQEADTVEAVDMEIASSYEGVYTVSDYDRDGELYIYSYQRDGLLYTFYCTGAGIDQFFMYAIQTA
ncbi:hypothetical protein [Pseudoflavonifractor phocaeensis]|uniref:hypothetical protein n=1 Tax=Pseudoflavonifractor phocaeensis TaxID=1870988 RepID=UPI001958B047|nr:hypothetical protein [Pseudoflavonifractor phocaeensis]